VIYTSFILIVPAESGAWTESLNPFAFRFAAPDTTLPDGIRRELNDAHAQGEMLQRLWQTDVPDALKNSVTGAIAQRPWYDERNARAVATLAGVDGAVVLTRGLYILGFGAKIAVGNEGAPRVSLFRPEPGSQEVVLEPLEKVGGTRHQSAVRFTATNKDAVAIVVSQDGHVSVVHWDDQIDAVAVVRNAEWWL
jgi:hypothetical protein